MNIRPINDGERGSILFFVLPGIMYKSLWGLVSGLAVTHTAIFFGKLFFFIADDYFRLRAMTARRARGFRTCSPAAI